MNKLTQYDEIISVELLEEEVDTLDISVSGDNLFYVNNILTHNSAFNQSDPGMETISESIGLAATADVIVSIYQNEEDRELGIIRLGMMKNRYGPRGHTQAMRIDYTTLTITQAEESAQESSDSTYNMLQSLGS
jgi:hypothetical protein